jgi:glucokinase
MISMGVDVGGTNLRVGAVSSKGELLFSFKESTPAQASPEVFIQVLCGLVQQVQSQVQEKYQEPLVGLGLGWPGVVRKKEGVVLETPNIKGFKHFPLKAELEKLLKIPCEIENDANCAGLAEKRFGAAQNFENFLLLTFGTGIGGAIFANSHLLRGHSGLAGEIGHMCLHPGGIQCGCGSRGCLEKYVSAKALESRAFQKWNREISARDILSMSDTDPQAAQLIKDYVVDLSLALGSLMNIFDPEAFVFSGGLFTTGGAPILRELETSLTQQGYQSIKQNVKLVSSNLEGKAGIIGAASLMLPA